MIPKDWRPWLIIAAIVVVLALMIMIQARATSCDTASVLAGGCHVMAGFMAAWP